MNPQYPIFIPSKGRAASRLTARYLDQMRVPFRMVIEEPEYAEYAQVIRPDRLLILDPAYQRDYDAQMTLQPEDSRGSGPARNFIWDLAAAEGHAWHWVIDDNCQGFYRLNRNVKILLGDGTGFRVMEDFVERYTNIGLAAPNYDFFLPRRLKKAPFTLNTRIFSCILIRTALPFRWRCRYNEDLDLSLRALKAGWCTVLFNAFACKKVWTQQMSGGNTAAFYATVGTRQKSEMIVRLHPDVARLMWRYGRWHHYVDYRGFAQQLCRKPDLPAPQDYGFELVRVRSNKDGRPQTKADTAA